MKLSRRSLLAGLLLCLPLSGVKNKKKRYIKFKKPEDYTCVDSKTRYKCSFKVIPDEEYELVSFSGYSAGIYNHKNIHYGYASHKITINYNGCETEIICGFINKNDYEILEK